MMSLKYHSIHSRPMASITRFRIPCYFQGHHSPATAWIAFFKNRYRSCKFEVGQCIRTLRIDGKGWMCCTHSTFWWVTGGLEAQALSWVLEVLSLEGPKIWIYWVPHSWGQCSNILGGYSTNKVRWSKRVLRCTSVVIVFHRRAYSDVLPLSVYKKVRSSTIGLKLSYFAHCLFLVSGITDQDWRWLSR